MSDDTALVVRDEGPVRHLILDRPRKLNALDLDQHVRIKRAVEAATADQSVRVLVLSGEGRAFCAGDDLTAEPPEGEDPMAGRRVDLDLGAGPAFLLESAAVLRACPKPTVVLLHGHALGSGYDYSLSCDFRLATEDVNYGDPRIHRALWAAEGWSYKLPRLVNQSIVAPVAYLGETMDGPTAYARGLVHRVYPAGADLRLAAKPFFDELAGLDPRAYAQTKARMLASVDLDFAHALAFSP
ncbi:MAG: enoyl-CoA hydratase/isomerase family protein [Gammaproteobacteria bacterium]|nr:enoyl-CoA hydratase/isomerase family protein [Gammaproteobacteria bacterium]MYF29912.1 enoyl-CoA hydratase/isomerase family protein [Gammaproteobacteria bacterium]MYK45492.1 enoyl-CoA hydratase/isomerase family protein [Gammaproteobacteria bacterium]